MNPQTEFAIRPEVQRFLDTAEEWPMWVFQGVGLAWIIALIFIPFFLWGIYSQAHKQTKLMRDMLAELRRLK